MPLCWYQKIEITRWVQKTRSKGGQLKWLINLPNRLDKLTLWSYLYFVKHWLILSIVMMCNRYSKTYWMVWFSTHLCTMFISNIILYTSRKLFWVEGKIKIGNHEHILYSVHVCVCVLIPFNSPSYCSA